MIDSHCHLDLGAFADDIDEVLQRATNAGVSRLLIPGTTPTGWQRQRYLASQYPQIDIAFGLHPYFLAPDNTVALAELALQLSDLPASCKALGEMGLDAVVEVPLDVQQQVLLHQLSLANECSLPVILHHRKTHHLLLSALKQSRFLHGGVVHAFSGSRDVASAYIDAGFKLGIGGIITYPRAQKTRQTVKDIALEHVLLETDAPDMPLAGYQGQRNEPAQIKLIANELAVLKGMDVAEVEKVTTANYYACFSPD